MYLDEEFSKNTGHTAPNERVEQNEASGFLLHVVVAPPPFSVESSRRIYLCQCQLHRPKT